MPEPKRLLRLKETEKKVGLKRDTIYRGGREGWFPKPVKISDRATGWVESEIDAWIESRIAAARTAPDDSAAPPRRRRGDARRAAA